MKIKSSDKKLCRMRFYISIVTRYRMKIFHQEALYLAFEDAVRESLTDNGCELIEVSRGAISKRGTHKYKDSFCTFHIKTTVLGPEQIFRLIYNNGWEAICRADAGRHGYELKTNYLTQDYLILGEEEYNNETVFEYAFTRSTRSRVENEQDHGNGPEEDDGDGLHPVRSVQRIGSERRKRG